MIHALVKDFGLTFEQFRELNKDANEFINLFEHPLLKEKRLFHGFYYIRMVNLANYDYYAS